MNSGNLLPDVLSSDHLFQLLDFFEKLLAAFLPGPKLLLLLLLHP